MALTAKLYRIDARRGERVPLEADATLRAPSGEPLDAVVNDLSEFGFRVEIDGQLAIGDAVSLGLPGLGMAEAIVVRQIAGEYGCEFLRPVNAALIADAANASTVVTSAFGDAPAFRLPSHEAEVTREGRKLPVPARVAITVLLAIAAWAVVLGSLALLF